MTAMVVRMLTREVDPLKGSRWGFKTPGCNWQLGLGPFVYRNQEELCCIVKLDVWYTKVVPVLRNDYWGFSSFGNLRHCFELRMYIHVHTCKKSRQNRLFGLRPFPIGTRSGVPGHLSFKDWRTWSFHSFRRLIDLFPFPSPSLRLSRSFLRSCVFIPASPLIFANYLSMRLVYVQSLQIVIPNNPPSSVRACNKLSSSRESKGIGFRTALTEREKRV